MTKTFTIAAVLVSTSLFAGQAFADTPLSDVEAAIKAAAEAGNSTLVEDAIRTADEAGLSSDVVRILGDEGFGK